MAYKIYYGGSLLYTPNDPYRPITSARLAEHAYEPSKLTFSMPPEHVMYDGMALHDPSNPIRVQWNSADQFIGYITRFDTDIDGVRTVTAKDLVSLLEMPLAKLSDVGFESTTATVSEVLDAINSCYNLYQTNVDAKCLSISVSSTTYGTIGYVNADISEERLLDVEPYEVMSPWAMLKKWVIDKYNVVTRTSRTNQVGYGFYVTLAGGAFAEHATPIVRGVNMTAMKRSELTDDLVTGFYVTGAKYTYVTTADSAAALYLVGRANVGDTEITVKGSSADFDYTINDGDMLCLASSSNRVALKAYLPLSRSMRIVGNTDEHTLPLTMPLNYAIGSANVSTLLNVLSMDSVYDERQGTVTAAYNVIVDGVTYWVVGNSVYAKDYAVEYGYKFEQYTSGLWFNPTLLRDAAIAELAKRLELSKTFDVDAISPAFYTSGGELYRVGNLVPVQADELGIDESLLISGATTDLLNPSATRYEIGYPRKTVTQRISDVSASQTGGSGAAGSSDVTYGSVKAAYDLASDAYESASRVETHTVSMTTASHGGSDATVTFGTTMPDTDYRVLVQPVGSPNGFTSIAYVVTDKTTAGFKVHSYNDYSASITQTLDIVVVHD